MKHVVYIIVIVVVLTAILMYALRKADIAQKVEDDTCILAKSGDERALCFKEIKTEGVTTNVLIYVNKGGSRKIGVQLPQWMTAAVLIN